MNEISLFISNSHHSYYHHQQHQFDQYYGQANSNNPYQKGQYNSSQFGRGNGKFNQYNNSNLQYYGQSNQAQRGSGGGAPRKIMKQSQSQPMISQMSLSSLQQQRQQGAEAKPTIQSSQGDEKGAPDAPNTKLFIGNLPRNITLKEVIELFKPFGAIDESNCALKVC